MPTLQVAPRARHADAPRRYYVVVNGPHPEVLGTDLPWDDAVELAGAWNRECGSRVSWAWIEPIAAEGRKGVAA